MKLSVKTANAIQKRKSDAHAKKKRQSELHREMVSSDLVFASQKKNLFFFAIYNSVSASIMLRIDRNHKI